MFNRLWNIFTIFMVYFVYVKDFLLRFYMHILPKVLIHCISDMEIVAVYTVAGCIMYGHIILFHGKSILYNCKYHYAFMEHFLFLVGRFIDTIWEKNGLP